MAIMDGSVEYELKTIPSIEDLNISDFAHIFLDDTSASEVRNTLDLISKNELGYRKPNTTYSVGNITYYSALPTGWYLECTTAGTSSSSDLTISSPSIGNMVSDGTVVWTIGKNLSVNGGTMTGTTGISKVNDNTYLFLSGGPNAAVMRLYGKDYANAQGVFELAAFSGEGTPKELLGFPSGTLLWMGNDLGGSAIVAKSLGWNGYIKYASGLILQWGAYALPYGTSTTEYTLPVPFNISFATDYHRIVCSHFVDNINNHTAIAVLEGAQYNSSDKFTVRLKLLSEATDSVIYGGVSWFAIGY